MPFERFLIAPYNSGLITAVKPWLIPDEAMSVLNNAYLYENRIRKRWGTQVLDKTLPLQEQQLGTRLRISIPTAAGTTDPAGNASGNLQVLLNDPGLQLNVGQQFSIGSQIFTITDVTTPGLQVMLNTSGLGTGRFDGTTGNYDFMGVTFSTQIYFYPSYPVMGLRTYEQIPPIFDKTIAFDGQYAYEYNFFLKGWDRLAGGADVWSGTTVDFFWTLDYQGRFGYEHFFFVTNNQEADGIRYWDGSIWTKPVLPIMVYVAKPPAIPLPNPPAGTFDLLLTAKILVQFKNRMLVFNVTESNWDPTTNPPNGAYVTRTYANRCRYSAIGNVLDENGTGNIIAWRQDRGAGNGGFRDAPTEQAIIAVEFVRDRLIVYFETSSWELVYTGNEAFPFRWQQINSELGVESTFSIVPLDKVAIGVGSNGVHACNSTNVERIDQKIYHEVYNVRNGNQVFYGTQLVYGIRDFFSQQLYWTFPDRFDTEANDNRFFSSRIFVFNYNTQSWAFFDDSITCFGYFYPFSDDPAAPRVYQAGQRLVIGGNSQGFTFLIHPDFTAGSASVGLITNVSVVPLTITITSRDHNLKVNDYIYFENSSGLTNFDNLSRKVLTVPNDNTFTVENFPVPLKVTGTYKGGGTFVRVSRIEIQTKEYNFYAKENRNQYVNQVNFLMDRTDAGQFTVDYFVSASTLPMLGQSSASGALIGTGTIETSPYGLSPLESSQTRMWHPTYLQAEGEVIQMKIYLSDLQMEKTLGVTLAKTDFQMHAFLFFAQPTGYLR